MDAVCVDKQNTYSQVSSYAVAGLYHPHMNIHMYIGNFVP